MNQFPKNGKLFHSSWGARRLARKAKHCSKIINKMKLLISFADQQTRFSVQESNSIFYELSFPFSFIFDKATDFVWWWSRPFLQLLINSNYFASFYFYAREKLSPLENRSSLRVVVTSSGGHRFHLLFNSPPRPFLSCFSMALRVDAFPFASFSPLFGLDDCLRHL